MPTVHARATHDCEEDVVVVGGGPAGCSAAVFAARDGLDVLVFDRGRSSLKRCAHLENYLGFPAGIDVETCYALMHDHLAAAGADRRDDLVEAVARRESGPGFVVDPQEGDAVTARRVVAATRYDGEYLRGLDDDDAMFDTHEHDGEDHEHFDREYADHDGSTPVSGLYVASPSAEADRQAIVAAGRGARVGLAVVEAARIDQGYPEVVADRYDWLRREAELQGEWADRDRWREWFDDQIPADHGLDDDRLVELRENAIDMRYASYVDDADIERRRDAGHDRLVEHVDDERILEHVHEEQLLEQVDDERILEHVEDERILEHADDDSVLARARAIDAEREDGGTTDGSQQATR